MNENKDDAVKKRADEVTFNLFVTGLMMEALVALGEAENPLTKKKELNEMHARFIIDTLSVLQEKTKNNLVKDESDLLENIIYSLRMKYAEKMKPNKEGGAA